MSHQVGRDGVRAGDHDREHIAEFLREQHLAGRLDSEEHEQRLERCLAAKSYAELGALTADLPSGWAAAPSPDARADRSPHATIRRMRRVLYELAALVAILLLAIWALSGHGYFWPAWAWFGLALPLAFDVSIRWAWRRPGGAERRALVLWTLFGCLEAGFVVVWVLTALSGPASDFWPVWPLMGFVAIAGGYSVIVLGTSGSGRATLAARIDALTRSREQAADAEAAELRRIERDLHDGAQARLVALSMQLGRAELALEDRPGARLLVEDAQREARRAIADLRSLARGITPPLLSDRGLPAAARELAARHGAALETDPVLETRRLAPALERGAYFVVAEALTNAAKHAAADRISVRLTLADGELVVTVADDGRGGADPGGSGLRGLRDRVEALGGTMALASALGEGTTLEARFPAGS
jgi:signal transduction histidine kinase